MGHSVGEWGTRLVTPDLSEVAHLFVDPSGELVSKNFLANITPPEGQAFAYRLTQDDQLLVTQLTVNHDTLHPRVVHHTVKAAEWAGRVVLGRRLRFFHASEEPVMDLADKDGLLTPANVKLCIGNASTFHAIGFRELPVNKHDDSSIIRPQRLYAAALGSLNLPPLPPDVLTRIARQTATLSRPINETLPPRNRSRE